MRTRPERVELDRRVVRLTATQRVHLLALHTQGRRRREWSGLVWWALAAGLVWVWVLA